MSEGLQSIGIASQMTGCLTPSWGCIGIQHAWYPYLLHLPAFQLVIAPFSLYCAQPAGEFLYLLLVIPQLVLQRTMVTSGSHQGNLALHWRGQRAASYQLLRL